MDYLFFDTECANCFDGIGKVCEFGYILTDSSFNVIKKESIIINPESPFDKKGLKMGNISLALPYDEYKKYPPFPKLYAKIKKILTRPNTLPIGYSTFNDANFIQSTIERYGLPTINYAFLDIEKIVEDVDKRKDHLKLIEVYSSYYPTVEKHHTGLIDAILTKDIAKHFDKKKIKFSKLIKNKNYYGEAFLGRIFEYDNNVLPYSNSNKMNKKNSKMFKELTTENKKCKGKSYKFKDEYLKENFPNASLVVYTMTQKNLKYGSGKEIPISKITNLPKMSFLKELGLNILDFKDINLEKIYSQVGKYKGWYKQYLLHVKTLPFYKSK